MGADFFDGFYDSNYYFDFCFSVFQYALAVLSLLRLLEPLLVRKIFCFDYYCYC